MAKITRKFLYATSTIVIALAVSWGLRSYLKTADLIMVFVAASLLVAATMGVGPAVWASFLSIILFSYVFVPPAFGFGTDVFQYVFAFIIMVLLAVSIARTSQRQRLRAEESERREQDMRDLLDLSTELSSHADMEELGRISADIYRRKFGKDLHAEAVNAKEAAFQSVTRQALQRQELMNRYQQVQFVTESEKSRNALLSAVSHDLRTPLSSIMGASSSLLEDKLSEQDEAKLLSIIFEESRRMLVMVEKILDMARLSSSTIKPELSWQAIDELVEAALRAAEPHLRGFTRIVEIPDDLPLVKLDPVLFERALVNLIENAGKHSSAPGEIRVAAYVEDNVLRVSVSDDGPGIPQHKRDMVFEKFQGASNGGKGVGLGLAIARTVIELHGGHVVIEDGNGIGTVMVISLPLNESLPVSRMGEMSQ